MNFLSIPLSGWLTLIALFATVSVSARPMGLYMARIFEGKPTFLSNWLGPIEAAIYRAAGVQAGQDDGWQTYAKNVFFFSLFCFATLFLTIYGQAYPEVSADLAFNIAASFSTNTGWQSYVPETTLTPISQTLGIAVHNVIAASITLAVMAAFIRGFTHNQSDTIGNFWVDLTRSVLYILFPASVILGFFLVSQGVIQTLSSQIELYNLESKTLHSVLAGPVASFDAIKILTASGGGYYNANAAHPFENPTPLANFIQMAGIIFIQTATIFCFGRMVRNDKLGHSIYASMMILFIPFALIGMAMESNGNPLIDPINIDHSLGNLEGKDLRLGTADSFLWTALTTATSNGATNSAIDSFKPLSTIIPLMFIHFGEVVFGGVGSGLYCMMAYLILSLFFASLMIGRAPELSGKKIGPFEIQMLCLIILVPAILSLLGTAIAVSTDMGRAGASNPGEQAFNQLLYAFSSSSNTNGSALAGINANTPFFNILLGLCIIMVRFAVTGAVLALSGSLAQKARARTTGYKLDPTKVSFVILLVVVVLLVDILTFIPSFALGPVAGHFHMIESVGGG